MNAFKLIRRLFLLSILNFLIPNYVYYLHTHIAVKDANWITLDIPFFFAIPFLLQHHNINCALHRPPFTAFIPQPKCHRNYWVGKKPKNITHTRKKHFLILFSCLYGLSFLAFAPPDSAAANVPPPQLSHISFNLFITTRKKKLGEYFIRTSETSSAHIFFNAPKHTPLTLMRLPLLLLRRYCTPPPLSSSSFSTHFFGLCIHTKPVRLSFSSHPTNRRRRRQVPNNNHHHQYYTHNINNNHLQRLLCCVCLGRRWHPPGSLLLFFPISFCPGFFFHLFLALLMVVFVLLPFRFNSLFPNPPSPYRFAFSFFLIFSNF